MEQVEQKDSKDIVLDFYGVLFNKEFFDYDKMEELLGENFEQHSDGRVKNREHIMKHFEGHKRMKQTSDIDFKLVLSKNEIVFAHYHITRYKPKGGAETWEVLAKFEVLDGKLHKMEQLSHVLNDDIE